MKPLKIILSNLKKDAVHNLIMIVFVALSVFFMDITLSEFMHMNYINNAVKNCGLYEEYIYAAPPSKHIVGDGMDLHNSLWEYEKETLERFKRDGVIEVWYSMDRASELLSDHQNSEGLYDDRIISYHYPRELLNEMSFPLSRGKWFDKYESDDGIPPIVVGSDLASRFKVGEVVQICHGTWKETKNYRVIGVLRRNTMLLSLGAGGSGMDLNSCFDSGDDCNGSIIFCDDEINDPYAYGGVVIKVSEENRQKVFDELADIGYMFSFKELSDAAEYNNRNLTEMQSVIFILMMIVCVTGVSSGNLLSTIALKKKYAVYFMCGMEWRTGVMISLAENVIKLVIPAGIGYAMFLDWYGKNGFENMRLTEANVIVTVLFVGLIFLLTSLMPLLNIKKTAPVKIITEM
ncbi:MAG: ABC transporter permease [Oscillospiraceae bacterium]|nr:ABC transporter permease [Oscillospiraceae bacterium]